MRMHMRTRSNLISSSTLQSSINNDSLVQLSEILHGFVAAGLSTSKDLVASLGICAVANLDIISWSAA